MSTGWKEFRQTGELKPERPETYKLGLLVVDDEQGIVEALTEMFSELFELHHTTSASEALELFRQHDPRLVITDQRMPELSGLDLLARIKELSPHCVRLLITGYSDINVAIRAINDGLVWKYITKPWDHQELRDLVLQGARRYLDQQGGPPAVWRDLLGM